MKLAHWLSIVFLVSAALTLSMWINSGLIFLVLRYDPSIGKWQPMEYREQDQKGFQSRGVAAPSVAELHQLFNEHKTSGERAFSDAVRDKYYEFYNICMYPVSGGPLVGKRKWSTANPLFYALLALAAVSCICYGTVLYRSKFKTGASRRQD